MFLEKSIKISNVHFIQHLTHEVFSELIKFEFSLVTEMDEDAQDSTSDPMTTEKMLFDMLLGMFEENGKQIFLKSL